MKTKGCSPTYRSAALVADQYHLSSSGLLKALKMLANTRKAAEEQLSSKRDKTMKLKILVLALATLPGQTVLLPAQTFVVLHSFSAGIPTGSTTNFDGAFPFGGLVLSGDALYGTTGGGGRFGNGTVFTLSAGSTNFTTLYNFSATSGANSTNKDGARPQDGLIQSGNTLYGTAPLGGAFGYGTVFRLNTDGSAFTNLHSFNYNDGGGPNADLVLSSNILYGTTAASYSMGGTVFKINTDGSGFTSLHNFTPVSGANSTNSDGASPQAGLILSGNTLYGTTRAGGSSGNGTVFRLNTDGTDFTNLYNFSADKLNGQAIAGLTEYTNGDGVNPSAPLVLSGNTLFGTTTFAGTFSFGTVFKLNTDGSGFTNLHSFSPLSGAGTMTNSDGAFSYAALALSGNTLFGTTEGGGTNGCGTIFTLSTNGTGFTDLHSFGDTKLNSSGYQTNSDGVSPFSGLVLSGRTLYGTAWTGGSADHGTIFALTLPVPSLAIHPSGTKVVITWPTLSPNYLLQTATSLSSGSWSNITNGISTVGYDDVFTNAVNGQPAFFRLKQH